MASQKHVLLLFSLAVASSAVTGGAPQPPNQLLDKICDNTDHPPLCLATIIPFLTDEKIDVAGVLKFSIEASTEYSKEALAAAKNLANSKDTPPEIKTNLQLCKDSYSTAIENFSKTATALANNDVGTMKSVLSAVITFISDCEDEFTIMQERSPMTSYAERLTDMTSNSLAMIAQLQT